MRGGLILIGGGDHALVAAEAASLAGWQVLGCIAGECRDQLRLGCDEDLPGVLAAHPGARLHLAIGSIATRQAVLARLSGHAWATVIHPGALVSATAELADGAFIGPGAVVNARARIGAAAMVNSAAVVEHDCQVGELAHLAPGAVVGGGTVIGARCLVGLGARVRDHVRVGDDARVAMGAVVVGDVPPGATVMGVPARRKDR